MRHGRFFLLLTLLSASVLSGCEEKLETGYAPRRLDSGDADRRAFYAPEFSPDSKPTKGSGGMPDIGPSHGY
jgi:hypothetical protein